MFGKKSQTAKAKDRKLALEKKTLRTLDGKDLAQVAGGAMMPISRGRGTVGGTP